MHKAEASTLEGRELRGLGPARGGRRPTMAVEPTWVRLEPLGVNVYVEVPFAGLAVAPINLGCAAYLLS